MRQCVLRLFLLGLLVSNKIAAAAANGTSLLSLDPGDSHTTPVLPKPGVTSGTKKTGFFRRFTNKLLLMITSKPTASTRKLSTKSILGLVSLGLILISLGILVAGTSGGGASVVAMVFLAGIVTGFVSLFWKRSKTDVAEKKKSNTAVIVGLALGIGFVLALVIAFAGSSWH